ncbi:uncharacterized protein ACIBXB_020106 isoform 1-T2 [Morphnus guianensis]
MPVPCSGTAGNEHGQTQTAQHENATVTGRCRLAAREVEARRTGVARSGWHWQEFLRSPTTSRSASLGLTSRPCSSDGEVLLPGCYFWHLLPSSLLPLSPLQRWEPAELKSQECQLWECSIASQPCPTWVPLLGALQCLPAAEVNAGILDAV